MTANLLDVHAKSVDDSNAAWFFGQVTPIQDFLDCAGFLRDEGAIAPTDTRVTAAQLNAMFEAWDLLSDAQAEKKTTKYFRLLRAVERNGGTELGVMDQP